MTFREYWAESVYDKNSVLCAGLDPAAYDMMRGAKGLDSADNKLSWAIRYIDAVAPFAAALKPNVQYWKDNGDMAALDTIADYALEKGLVVIDDSKLADIGSTNEAGIFYAHKKGFSAVTLAPFAGNLEEMAEQGRKLHVGTISMCLMSNPQYEREKNMWVDVSDDLDGYVKGHLMDSLAPRYLQLARDANRFGIDGIVIGAPSDSNHIRGEELARVRSYVDNGMLVLLPGVGAQGGEAGEIWKHFGKDNVIVNVGRALMFPNGSMSDTADWKEAAEHYRRTLNVLRGG